MRPSTGLALIFLSILALKAWSKTTCQMQAQCSALPWSTFSCRLLHIFSSQTHVELEIGREYWVACLVSLSFVVELHWLLLPRCIGLLSCQFCCHDWKGWRSWSHRQAAWKLGRQPSQPSCKTRDHRFSATRLYQGVLSVESSSLKRQVHCRCTTSKILLYSVRASKTTVWAHNALRPFSRQQSCKVIISHQLGYQGYVSGLKKRFENLLSICALPSVMTTSRKKSAHERWFACGKGKTLHPNSQLRGKD